jgi:hypothetical protein
MPADTGPSPTMLERIFGRKKRRGDIELPPESGKVDPRLKKKTIMEKAKETKEKYNPFDIITKKIAPPEKKKK